MNPNVFYQNFSSLKGKAQQMKYFPPQDYGV